MNPGTPFIPTVPSHHETLIEGITGLKLENQGNRTQRNEINNIALSIKPSLPLPTQLMAVRVDRIQVRYRVQIMHGCSISYALSNGLS